MNDVFRCRDVLAWMRDIPRPEMLIPEWVVRTFPMDNLDAEQVRLARDNEIIRRLREAEEEHGE